MGGKIGEYRARLELLARGWHTGLLDRLLDFSREQIEAAGDFLDTIDSDDDALLQDELVVLDELVGMTFATCQTTITAFASAVDRLDRFASKRDVDVLPGVARARTEGKTILAPRARGALLDLGPRKRRRKYPEIVYLDAFANYWKHHAEWPYGWHKPKVRQSMRGVQRRTADVCAAAGLTSTRVIGNLRHASKFLGNPAPFTDVAVLTQIVEQWEDRIRSLIESELLRLRQI